MLKISIKGAVIVVDIVILVVVEVVIDTVVELIKKSGRNT
jgi:hypothetical protein